MNCPVCGRFMKQGGYYTNDHLDSWEDTWKCTIHHPTEEQKAEAKKLVAEARKANEERRRAEVQEIFLAARRHRIDSEGL